MPSALVSSFLLELWPPGHGQIATEPTTVPVQPLHLPKSACAALESALASTIKGTITLSTDVDDADSNLTCSPQSAPSTLSPTASFSDNSDYALIKAEPVTPSINLWQRKYKKKTSFWLKLSGIAPPILKQQATHSDWRILEMFTEPVKSRMESREHITNVAKHHCRDRDLQTQPVAQPCW